MNLRTLNKLFILVPGIFYTFLASAQIEETGIAIPSYANNKMAEGTLQLPFWEDFFNQFGAPSDSLWLNSGDILINDHYGYLPPSSGVATFDGLKGNGDAYNVDPESSAKTDRLVSNFIDLSTYTPDDNIYFSYFYQLGGYGETPDPGDGDKMVVEFKTSSGNWQVVATLNPADYDPQEFYQFIYPITDDQYLHSEFQFAIQIHGNQAGPYDIWNVDYIYINEDRNANDLFYPDATIVEGITNIFFKYHAIPRQHFDKEKDLVQPYYTVTTLRNTFHNYRQSIYLELETTNGGLINRTFEIVDEGQSPIKGPIGGEFVKTRLPGIVTANYVSINDDNSSNSVTLKGIQDEELGIPDSSIIRITMKVAMRSYDNTYDSGEYDTSYEPIDFRSNDTISRTFILEDYYAYDDGTAESSVSLQVSGDRMAYRYVLNNADSAYIHGIDMNNIVAGGSAIGESITLNVFNSINGMPGDVLRSKEYIITGDNSRTSFTRYEFVNPVLVTDTFFIGLTSNTTGRVPIGLDKNNDSSSEIYEFVQGEWLPLNGRFTGAVMIRPFIGPEPEGFITGIERDEQDQLAIYPNPSWDGVFRFSRQISDIVIYDISGHTIEFAQQVEPGSTQIIIPQKGLFIIKVFLNNRHYIFKVISR